VSSLSGLDLCLAYHGTTVVSDASITLRGGEITTLIGPNGSGKSTLLRTMAGQMPGAAHGFSQLSSVNSLKVFRRRSEFGSESSHRFWNSITRRVMAHPVVSLVLGAGILIVASLSYFNIETGFSGVSTMPDDAPSRQAFEILATEFSGGLSSPVQVVVDGDDRAPIRTRHCGKIIHRFRPQPVRNIPAGIPPSSFGPFL
jgi:energy-coupling factor transporter ATP-binding protein EcfA2